MSGKKFSKLPRAEMLPAFLWICSECGTDNFERSIVVELSPEEMLELREDHGVEVWQDGEFTTAPDHVVCRECKTEFETEHFRQADEMD